MPRALLRQDARHQRRPPRLVVGPEPRAVVTMEVLVEQHVVPPQRVALKSLGSAIDRPSSIVAAKKNACQSARQVLGNIGQRHRDTGTARVLNDEVVTVVTVKFPQRLD